MLPVILFLISIGLQLTAALAALLLIRTTGRKLAWILLSIAMILMAWRRIVSFVSLLSASKTITFELPEIIALIISCLMLAGVLGIRTYFHSIRTTEEERNRAEDALHTLSSRQKAILESVPDIIMEVDNNKVYAWANPAGSEFFGEDVIGKEAAFYFEGEQKTYDTVEPLFKGNEDIIYVESWQRRRDGEKRLLAWWCRVLKDKNGRVTGAISSARDITDRKRAEEALKKSQHFLAETEQIGKVGGWEFNIDTQKLTWTEEVYHIHEVDLNFDPTVEKAVNFYNTASRSIIERAVQRAIEHGEPYDVELEIITAKGNLRSVHAIGKADLENRRVYGFFQDITERKDSEERLKESEQRFREMAENIQEVFWLFDWVQKKVIYVNPAYEQIWGRSIQDLYNRYEEWADSIHPDDREYANESFARILESSGGESREYRIIKPDGTVRWVSDKGFAIRDKTGQITRIVGIAEDITDRKKIEQEVLKMEKLESVGQLAGGLAHDFNNLLTSILGNVSLAKMCAEKGEDVQEILAEAENASFRARDLTQQLLTFSKGGAPVKKATSICELVKESSSFALRGSNVRCDFPIPQDLWPAEVDQGQISQVIHNLVINADQAMPEGGLIRITCENIILDKSNSLSLEQGKYVRISMTDQGHGIPEEQLTNIFDPYFTTKEKGRGLGLSSVYSIIKRHKGLITADSQVGKGATFTIYLPASSEKPLIRKDLEEEILSGHGRILIMDDEESVRTLAARLLSSLGYETELAEDGEKAIALYKNSLASGSPFDAVIMDLTIPGGMGGKDTIKQIRAIDPKVKAIVSSGYSTDPIMSEYKKYGFSGVMAKPYKLKDVSQILHDLLA